MNTKPIDGEINILASYLDEKDNTVNVVIATIKKNNQSISEQINIIKNAIEAYEERNYCCTGWRTSI